MINFLHTFQPNSILINLGPITIYWYGLMIVLGVLSAIIILLKLAGYYNIPKEPLIDLSFWLIIGGVIGARIYHIFLELPFYLDNPIEMIKIWKGGLAIHGGIIVGLFVVWRFVKKHNFQFFQIASLLVPGVALAQAIGRWGNYFNQELFGKPTNLPWGIPIAPENRIIDYYNSQYFHPTFLYESLGNLFIFLVLIYLHSIIIRNNNQKNIGYEAFIFIYLIGYSLLRFLLEFVRIDTTPAFLGLRFPQIMSLIIIVSIFFYKKTLKLKALKKYK